jgi:hypothetical protein
MSSSDPMTKQDGLDLESRLKLFIVERENAWVKWIVGIQITYFAITLAAVWFIVGHIKVGG